MQRRIDLAVLKDITWWSWNAMIALLVTRFAAARFEPIYAAIALALALVALDLSKGKGLRAMGVQIRLGYVVLLLIGLIPGFAWMHIVQILGTSARVLTGYCLLERELKMLPWNAAGHVGFAEMFQILLAKPGAGGLIRFDDRTAETPSACAIG